MSHTVDERERIRLRSRAIAEMNRRLGNDLQAPDPMRDMSRTERHSWEQRLALPHGALSWSRFAAQFKGNHVYQVVDHLFMERGIGKLVRPESDDTDSLDLAGLGPLDRVLAILEFVELSPRETLWLPGERTLTRKLKPSGVELARVRQGPEGLHFDRFGLVVICPGKELLHKYSWPWTNTIRRLPAPVRPETVTTRSSIVSNIADDLYQNRVAIRQAVRAKRAA